MANTDRGHTSDLTPLSVNVGDMVLSQLYRNDEMDWVITDAADAVEGAKSGQYYAAIVLPPSLSDDMFTFYTGDAEPSKIDLYVNEKKNPISPLLISNGTQGVSAQINASFTRALSEVSFGLIESASDFFNEAETQKALNSIETRVVGTRNQMLSSANTVDALASLMESSVPLVASAERLSTSVGANLNSIQPANLDGIGAGVGGSAAALGAALSATSDSFGPVNDRIDELLSNSDQTSAATAKTLTDAAAAVDVQINQYVTLRDRLNSEVGPALPPEAQPALTTVTGNINDVIARETGVRDRLNDTAARLSAGRASPGDQQEIKDSIARARDAIATARGTFDNGVRPKLEALSGSVDQIGGSVDKARSDIDRVSASLANQPGSVQDSLATSGATLRDLATQLRDNAGQLADAQQSIAEARSNNDLSKLSDLVSQHPEDIANALVDPVKVDRQEVYPRVSFGAGMAPLYTVLALWVGALLTAVALRMDEDSYVQHAVGPEKLTPAQKYLGRYLTFAITGLAQSTLIMAGLILYVEIQPAHPFLLFVAGWISSLVFHLICFTLVLSLSNAGKAIGVLILVLQISAAGGAYPLQLLPGWVKALSPWLPATYSIQAMRAAEFGTYHWDFWRAIGMLLLFGLPFLLIGLFVRTRIEPFIGKMEDAAAETKVIMTA